MRESEHVAALRTALGKSLAGHRERSGLSQRELAERLYYDRTSISKMETGQQPATRTFWYEADSLLGARGELVAGFDALTAAKASDGKADMPAAEGHRMTRAAQLHGDPLIPAMPPIMRAVANVRSTSANPEQIDAVIELGALSRALAEHSRRVLMGEPADWAEITERLDSAAIARRRRFVIEPCAAGESGRS